MNLNLDQNEIQFILNVLGDLPAKTGMSDSDWADCLSRNKSHLNIMLAKPWWTTQNLEPLQQAAA